MKKIWFRSVQQEVFKFWYLRWVLQHSKHNSLKLVQSIISNTVFPIRSSLRLVQYVLLWTILGHRIRQYVLFSRVCWKTRVNTYCISPASKRIARNTIVNIACILIQEAQLVLTQCDIWRIKVQSILPGTTSSRSVCPILFERYRSFCSFVSISNCAYFPWGYCKTDSNLSWKNYRFVRGVSRTGHVEDIYLCFRLDLGCLA